MVVAFLARVLFGVALLAQALSLPSAGFSASAPMMRATSGGGLLCAILHGASADAKKSVVSLAGSGQAPSNDSTHRHGLCSFCQMGAGAPPLDYSIPPTVRLRIAWTRPVFAAYADGIVFFRANHNAPARAPPTFA